MPARGLFTRRADYDPPSLPAWRVTVEACGEFADAPSELNGARLRGALFIELLLADQVARELEGQS